MLTAAVLLAAGVARAESVSVTASRTLAAGDTSLDQQDITVSGCTLTVEGPHTFSSLMLTNGAVLTHPACTAAVEYRLDLEIDGRLAVAADSRIDVKGRGYLMGRTLGNTTAGASAGRSGGSHGGLGGFYLYPQNAAYGDPRAPVHPGSGAANFNYGGAGGGVVRLRCGDLLLNGTICADGLAGSGTGAGGAGGSVWIETGTLSGAGTIAANGGGVAKGYASGGGGRVAVVVTQATAFDFENGVRAASATAPNNGSAGTVYTCVGDAPGTLLLDNRGVTSVEETPLSLPLTQDWLGTLTLRGSGLRVVSTAPYLEARDIRVLDGAVLTHPLGSTNRALFDGVFILAVWLSTHC